MKKMKRMMDGGMADMRRPGTMVQPGVPSGPRRGGRPFDPKPFPPIVSPGPRPIRPIVPPDPGDIRPIGPPETKPGRPRVPPGPKIGVRPADPKPANPRVTYGPRGPKTGVFNPVVDPPRPMGPRGPRGYGPNDGGPMPATPGNMTKADYIASYGRPSSVGVTDSRPFGSGPSPSFKKGGAVKSKAMRGGGLARKGVGMALAKGGLARRAGGCAKRGVGRGKIM